MAQTTAPSSDVILRMDNVSKIYISGLIKTTKTYAAKNISFEIRRGEILSLVGESGSGKTTMANLIMRQFKPTDGVIYLNMQKNLDSEEGDDFRSIHDIPPKNYYDQVQMVFQDPFSSFNYFYKVDRVLHQAILFRYGRISKNRQKPLIDRTLRIVGLNPNEVLGRYPHQLSGGQLQRFLLARVLLIKPSLVIADEPTSMIDACSRAGVLNLLKKLREEEGLSVLFITHDIGQAQYVSDRVIVMKEGDIVEKGPTKEVFLQPQHPYTKILLSAVPSIYRKWEETAL